LGRDGVLMTVWGGGVGNIVMTALFAAFLATGVARSIVTWISGS